MKLLLAVDGSRYSKKAVAFIVANRERLLGGERGEDATLSLLYVQQQLPARARSVVGAAIVNSYFEEEANKVIKPICKLLDMRKIQYTADWRVGVPYEEIVKASKRLKVHMIVMGTHGHGLIGKMLMGSVAQRVITESTVPVLLIK